MKKMFIIALAVIMIASCVKQQVFDPQTLAAPAQVTKTENINDLMAKAKWGDGAAYLKLAECYKDGRLGVKPDFLTTMTMLYLAKEYGEQVSPMEYMSNLPTDDNTRMAYEAMGNLDDSNFEKGIALAERLIEKGCNDGYALKGYALFLQGDSIGAMRLAAMAEERGSSMGKALQYITAFKKMTKMPDESIVIPLAEAAPVFYLFMAEEYTLTLDEHPENAAKAARAYLRANEKGLLDRKGAEWLLAYMESGNELPLSENDIQRLRKLADYENRQPQEMEYYAPETGFLDEEIDSVATGEVDAQAVEKARGIIEEASKEDYDDNKSSDAGE